MKITKAELSKSYDRLQSLRKRADKMKAQAQETTEKVVRTIEVGGMAFGMGVVQGKTGGVEVVGVPLELGVGLGLVGAGLFGLAGRASDHLINLGDGALATYLSTVGRGVGQEWAQKSTRSSGELPANDLRRVAAG